MSPLNKNCAELRQHNYIFFWKVFAVLIWNFIVYMVTSSVAYHVDFALRD